MVIFYSIFNKIIYQPVYKDITSNHRYILTFPNQFYILFLRERFQILQYFINKSVNYNFFIPSYCLKLAHIKNGLYHFAESVVLFRNHLYRLYGICIITWMLARMKDLVKW